MITTPRASGAHVKGNVTFNVELRDSTCSDASGGTRHTYSLNSHLGSFALIDFELLPTWHVDTRKSRMNRGRTGKSVCLGDSGKLVAEVKRKHPMEPYMIHPNSVGNVAWNLSGLPLIAYDCFVLPLEIFDPSETGLIRAVAWITRIYWTLNIAMSLFCGFVKPTGEVVMDPPVTLRHYSFSWLPLDLFVVVSDWLEYVAISSQLEHVTGALRLSRLFRALRALRVFRLIKAQYVTDLVSENIRSEQILLFVTVSKIMVMIFGFVHLVSCTWWAIGRWGSFEWIHSDDGEYVGSWIQQHNLIDAPLDQRYMTCFHWALSTLSGETLLYPRSTAEQLFTVALQFATFLLSASFISGITTAMTRLQVLSGEEARKTSTLKRYLADNNISQSLKTRIQRNAMHAFEELQRNMPEENVELLRIVSEPLHVELHFEVYGTILMFHPFFSCYHEVNNMGLRKICHSCVAPFHISSGDLLFMDGEPAAMPRMYFVLQGSLTYEQAGQDAYFVGGGHWLCEPCLWTSWVHCGTLRALSESRFLLLDAKEFQAACMSFPAWVQHCCNYGSEFVRSLNDRDRKEISDIGELTEELEDVVTEAFPFYQATCEDDRVSVASVDHEDADRASIKHSVARESRLPGWLRESPPTGNAATVNYAKMRRSSRKQSNRASTGVTDTPNTPDVRVGQLNINYARARLRAVCLSFRRCVERLRLGSSPQQTAVVPVEAS